MLKNIFKHTYQGFRISTLQILGLVVIVFINLFFSLKPCSFPLFSKTFFIQTQKSHPREPVGKEQEPRRVVVGSILLFCALFQS